ncbi:UDP-2,3-diacylglucosamine diphosphatase [Ferrimonas pelagia]|uniref:UDP-2,3-diacylglucosamine hydrolase n=1 Tax=Ferrimonas pelagia TaxID=1177826 RepID=A0ABP9E9Y5_9GAMM
MQSNARYQGAAVCGPRTLIIGDLHLCPSRPDITAAFARFVEHELENVEALYIVGDLFEFWIGDDDINAFTDQIAQIIQAATAKTQVYFSHGNRDFALGQRFSQRTGMILLPEIACVELYGHTTVILHGDSLCTDDVEYQKFRTLRNKPWFRFVTAAMPLKLRRYLSDRGRAKSKDRAQQDDYQIVDVTEQAVDSVMREYNASRMIHGHTHRPCIHQLDEGRERLVVGDWYSQESVLVLTQDGATLHRSAL